MAKATYALIGQYGLSPSISSASQHSQECSTQSRGTGSTPAFLRCPEDAAIIYTMMGCCKEAGADFRKWTNYFLDHIHEYDNDLSKPLDDFLPAALMERGLI